MIGRSPVVDVDDVLEKNALKTYPNPAKNTIFIEKTGNLHRGFPSVQLLSKTGQVVWEIPLDTNLTGHGSGRVASRAKSMRNVPFRLE